MGLSECTLAFKAGDEVVALLDEIVAARRGEHDGDGAVVTRSSTLRWLVLQEARRLRSAGERGAGEGGR